VFNGRRPAELVAQICNLLFRRFSTCPGQGCSLAAAPCKSAIRPVANLRCAFGLVAGLGLAFALNCSGASEISISTKAERGELEIAFKGRKLLSYAFATNQFKPYVREFYTLRGENVLRDAPPDHLHHHGLMYAVWVNGINFWEEKTAPGIEKHMDLVHVDTSDANGVPVAYFTELIHWLAPTNLSTPLLIERRTIAVAVDEKVGEVALEWNSQFQVGPKAGKVTLHGPNYDGLGLRLPESFNHVAAFQNSAGLPYPGKNTQNVIPARWVSVAGQVAGRDVTLVLFGRADNARGDGFFFSMLDPFAYLSATQGLDKKLLEYAAGDRFNLSYLLTVYAESKPTSFITRRGEAWEKERR
jgi:hypothetical protein